MWHIMWNPKCGDNLMWCVVKVDVEMEQQQQKQQQQIAHYNIAASHQLKISACHDMSL